MSKQVVKKEAEVPVVATGMDDVSAWGGDDQFTSQDMVISKIVPMQGLSKLVTERKAQIGEFRDLVNGKLIGSIDDPFEFIPFYVEKVWVKTITVKGKTSFDGIEPINASNENALREETLPNGDHLHRDYTYYFYVLLPKEIEDGAYMPYILSIKRTSLKEGKKMMTQMYGRNKLAKKSPAHYTMKMGGKLVSNDKGTFVVLDVNPMARETKSEELEAAFEMLKLVRSGETKIDHSDEVKESKPQGNYASENMEF